VPRKKSMKDPKAVTEEATSQTVSIFNSQNQDLNLCRISRQVLEEKIIELEKRGWYKKSPNNKVALTGERKDIVIGVFRDSYRLLDGSFSSMYELGEFFYKAKHRLGHYPTFIYWLKVLKCDGPGRWLVRVYEKYGSRLDQFAHLGLKKLWLAAKLADCVGFVERHEETIAAQSEDELKLLIRRVLSIKPRVMMLDGNENNLNVLRRAIKGLRCKVEKVVMEETPDLKQYTAQLIKESNPDLLIMNVRPFSEPAGIPGYDGMAAYKWLPRMPNIPVIYYMDESIKIEGDEWLNFMSLNAVAVLRIPFHEQEIKAAVNSAIRVIKAEKRLQWAYGDLEEVVASRTKQLRHEVQARRSAEEAAIASEQRLQAVFDRAADAIFIKDKSLRYQMVNQAMVLLLGHEESRVLGKTDEDFFEQEVAEHFKELEQRVLHGEAVEEQHSRLIHGMEMTFLDSRVPLRGGSGEIVGLCGFSRDVTERQGIGKGQFTIEHEYTSPAMRFCLEQAHVAADSDSIVLLLGESGSGKDHLARYIHDHSRRAVGPYFAINCAAVAKEVAESELFGHEKGAYTGAGSRKRGLLELAEGGTLLLNEIGDLSQPLQAKLLTFLDTKKFTRVGGEREVEVNARLVAATNRDLERAVQDGDFRRDLFYRLNVMPIIIPPLRERRDDLPLLVNVILHGLCEDMQYAELPVITPSTMKAFQDYDWPGNVRELRNVLERALILSGGASVDIVSDGGTIAPRSLGLPDQAATEKEEMRELRRGQIAWTNPAVSDKGVAPAVTNFHRLSPGEQGRHLKTILADVCGGESGSKGYLSDVIGVSTRTIDKRIKLVGGVDLKMGNPRTKARERLLPKIKQYLIDNLSE
jgi:PAS domain S-box-containing protein